METTPQSVIDRFHCLWYDASTTWQQNSYFGHRIQQLPLDLWLYQELICRERPAFVLQTGVLYGGSVLYFAHLFDLLGAGPEAIVIGIDNEITPDAQRLSHPRIRLLEGDSTSLETVRSVEEMIPAPHGFVSLDSDHTREHVLGELEIYHRFVGVGCHLVVEDTNINGHPVYPDFGPGPYEAVEEFLKRTPHFARDDQVWRRNLLSFHQYGWLVRVE
jgi:cephalosporin hydroxylase